MSSNQATAMQAAGPNDSTETPSSLLDVLGLVLQHSHLLEDVRDFCKLLETARAVAEAAAQPSNGRLALTVDVCNAVRTEAMVPWIARHGYRIGSLHLSSRNGAAAGAAAVVTALQQAAASQPPGVAVGLPLHSLSLSLPPAAAADVLQLAAVRQIVRCSLCLHGHPSDAADIARVAALLPRIGLQRLLLDSPPNQVMHALSACSNLVQLEVRQLRNLSLLSAVPSQLQELSVQSSTVDEAAPLQLQHSTALQKISMGSRLVLGPDDALPDSLRVLCVSRCASCQPLLACTSLKALTISAQPPPAAELQKLAQLPCLDRLKLAYYDAAASAGAWRVLPALKELALWIPGVNSNHFNTFPDVLQHLQQATSIQMLTLRVEGDPVVATAVFAVPLAAALTSLVQLEALALSGGRCLDPRIAETEGAVGIAYLAAAMSGLPRLSSLSLRGLHWGVAALHLEGCTALTRMELLYCSMSCLDLSRILRASTGLQFLHVQQPEHNGIESLTDACFSVIGRHLHKLVELEAHGCSAVTLNGVAQLAGLKGLRELRLGGCSQFGAADVRAALEAAGGGRSSLQLLVNRERG